MMRLATFFLLLMATSAIDSSKMMEEPAEESESEEASPAPAEPIEAAKEEAPAAAAPAAAPEPAAAAPVEPPKPVKGCFLGLFCYEEEDLFNKRENENEEHMNKVKEMENHINEIKTEKDARDQMLEAAEAKKKKERAINKQYCQCSFACGADDGSKCFDACCNDDAGAQVSNALPGGLR